MSMVASLGCIVRVAGASVVVAVVVAVKVFVTGVFASTKAPQITEIPCRAGVYHAAPLTKPSGWLATARSSYTLPRVVKLAPAATVEARGVVSVRH